MKKLFHKLTHLDRERRLHSLKTGIAVLLGIFLAKFFSFTNDQWLIIAIVVVMCGQISVGGLLQKSYMRVLGTFFGAAISALALIFFGNHSPLILSLIVCLAAMLFSYISTGQKAFNEAGVLGAVTVAIILINAAPTLKLAWWRFLQITLGILIAFLVSRFLFPQRAKKRLRNEIIANLRVIQNFYLNILAGDYSGRTQELENQIIKSFVTQRNLITEAARESFSKADIIYDEIVVCQREIVRSMDFIRYALQLSPKGNEFLANFVAIDEFSQQAIKEFEKIIDFLTEDKLAPSLLFHKINLNWTEEVTIALKEHEKSLTQEDIQHINLILFCAHLLADKLQELASSIKQFDKPQTTKAVPELSEVS